MAAAFLVLTIGGVMVYSAITGTSIVDVFAGTKNDSLDAQGGSKIDLTSAPQGVMVGGVKVDTGDILGTGGHRFRGPHAALLEALANAAVSQFHLRITSLAGGNHVANSYHFRHRAFDASGTEANMRAFAAWVANGPNASDVAELIHNPGPCIKNGHLVAGSTVFAAVWSGHRDHVHCAA